MRQEMQIRGRLAMAALVGIVGLALQGCVTDQGGASTEPVGPWQQDIRGLVAHIEPNETFWKEPDTEEPIDWTSRVWEVQKQQVKGQPNQICVWLEVPYTKQQTRQGLWPVPVQVLIPADSSLGSQVEQLNLRRGQSIHVKGTFKGFVHTGLDYSKPGEVTAFGQANDMASLMGMLSKMQENPLQEKAEAYAKSKRLPLGTTPDLRLILPNMEVKAQELELLR